MGTTPIQSGKRKPEDMVGAGDVRRTAKALTNKSWGNSKRQRASEHVQSVFHSFQGQQRGSEWAEEAQPCLALPAPPHNLLLTGRDSAAATASQRGIVATWSAADRQKRNRTTNPASCCCCWTHAHSHSGQPKRLATPSSSAASELRPAHGMAPPRPLAPARLLLVGRRERMGHYLH